MTAEAQIARLHIQAHDVGDAIEYCYEQGWTDGLPVVPPTPDRVQSMLDSAGRSVDEQLGFVEFRRRRVTVGRVAVNAVMAGCLPAYFPVVLAAVEAMLAEGFAFHLAAASTHSPAMLVAINGPVRQQLSVNCANNALSPGRRANATIGRAVRLVLLNICGAAPDSFDGGTMGNPAKYTYCFGEHEEASPWEPLHVERGLPADSSAATVFSADAPRQVNCRLSQNPEVILSVVVDMMLPVGNGSSRPDDGGFLIVMSPEHATTVARQGWSKQDVRRFLYERARRPLSDFKRLARLRGPVEPGDEQRLHPIVAHEEDIVVMVAGSMAGQYTLVIPTLAHHSVVTKPIRERA